LRGAFAIRAGTEVHSRRIGRPRTKAQILIEGGFPLGAEKLHIADAIRPAMLNELPHHGAPDPPALVFREHDHIHNERVEDAVGDNATRADESSSLAGRDEMQTAADCLAQIVSTQPVFAIPTGGFK
jgi:hypothetical protein